jgi:Protein of unknown function (DUF2384)
VSELDQSETKSPAESAEDQAEDLESLLVRIHKYLHWTSADPAGDVQEIRRFVEEVSAQFGRAREVLPSAAGDTSDMFKDERMTEPRAVSTAQDIDQPKRPTILNKLLIEVVDNPDAWLSTPSVHFGGRRPIDLVGTDEECKLIDLLQAVGQGLF